MEEEENEGKKKKVEVWRKKCLEKCKERVVNKFGVETGMRNIQKTKGKGEQQMSPSETCIGKSGIWLFLLLLMGQNVCLLMLQRKIYREGQE